MELEEAIEKLCKHCGCRNIEELWDYIGYLEDVKQDYEFLKDRVKYLANTTINQLH
jgi:hypothetical protein